MSGEILRLKSDKVRQLIKQGRIKLDGDPPDPSPIEGKPDEITTPINTPVNTFGGVSTKGVGRRRFLVGGVISLGGLTLAGIYSAVDYFTPLSESKRKILHTSFAANELPQGWSQISSRPDPGANFVLREARLKGSVILIDLQGQTAGLLNKSAIQLYILESSGNAESFFESRRGGGPYIEEQVKGIGDRALLTLSPDRTGNLQVQFDKFVFGVYPGQEGNNPPLYEQQLLSLGRATIKYLYRIGNTRPLLPSEY